MKRVILPAVEAVGIANGLWAWSTSSLECSQCAGTGIHGGPGGYYDVPGRGKPCAYCEGFRDYLTRRLVGKQVELWTDGISPENEAQYGKYEVWNEDGLINLVDGSRRSHETDVYPVPLNECVGTFTLADVVPIVGPGELHGACVLNYPTPSNKRGLAAYKTHAPSGPVSGWATITDQFPYSDWSIGRLALRFTT